MVSLSVILLFSLATYFEDHDRFLTCSLCHRQVMTDEIRSASNFKTFIKQIRNRIFEVYIEYLVYFHLITVN